MGVFLLLSLKFTRESQVERSVLLLPIPHAMITPSLGLYVYINEINNRKQRVYCLCYYLH